VPASTVSLSSSETRSCLPAEFCVPADLETSFTSLEAFIICFSHYWANRTNTLLTITHASALSLGQPPKTSTFVTNSATFITTFQVSPIHTFHISINYRSLGNSSSFDSIEIHCTNKRLTLLAANTIHLTSVMAVKFFLPALALVGSVIGMSEDKAESRAGISANKVDSTMRWSINHDHNL